LWSAREEERTRESDKKRREAKDKHEKCTKKRNDLWNKFRWRRKMLKKFHVCRSEPFTMLKTILFH
jgi:hypothetical protein